jgi:predicted transcriptional regulator
MSQTKDEAIALIQALPDDCSLEDIQYHLYVRAKVERGIRAINEGRTVPHDEAKAQVADTKLSPQGAAGATL